MKARITVLLFMVAVIPLLLAPAISQAEVEGSCTMCHKYPGLGRIEQKKDSQDQSQEIKRVFYINNALFETTYHGKISCKSCHTGVDKIPHTDAPVVNCATNCHIIDPSTDKPFSHKKIVDDFNASAHGKDGSHIKDKAGLPVCKDCHNNKTYHATTEKRTDSSHQVMVCKECHQSKEFVKRFYEHIIYRTSIRRSSKEVVKLCSSCHANQELMEKAELDTVVGFSTTFHAKAIQFGNKDVANCLSCHAPYQLGFSPHRITSARKENSPVHVGNKIETCRQSDCHAGAAEDFALGSRVHPSPDKIKRVAASSLSQGTDEVALIDDPVFQTKVLDWIQLFYKILILGVVGGLGFHRLLDLYGSIREHKKGGH